MFISIDAGGTNTRVAGTAELANSVFAGEPLRRKNTHDFDNDLAFMVGAALEIADGEPIEAVGIGTPGSPNEDKTEIKSAKNLASWAGKPLVASLSEGLGGCSVFYDNDVTAAGLGEAYYGHTEGDFDYVIWGTGIGGGGIRHEDDKPTVEVLNWRTYFGDWETDNGGAELAKRFGKAPEDFTIADWEAVAKDFKRHLVSYLETHRPQAIVFGGGLAVRHAQMIEGAGRNLGTTIEVTKFGDDSGLVGGFGLIRSGLTS
jgi:predicted NBD/HSP70 family sugar kinase